MNNQTVRFMQLLAAYPDRKITWQHDGFIGFSLGYKPINKSSCNQIYAGFPTHDTTAFSFYDMDEAEYAIFCTFLHSAFVQTTKQLTIGWTSNFHNCPKTKAWCLNITQAVKRLEQTKLPNLKSLILGEYLLLCNASEVYGWLGDITHVLQQNNHIEALELRGIFELQRPISFKQLKNFTLCFEDPASHGFSFGGISNQTWLHILNSDMPDLIEADIGLVFENSPDFTFNDRFLNKEMFPNLKRLYFTASLSDREWQKIEQSNLAKTTELIIDKV